MHSKYQAHKMEELCTPYLTTDNCRNPASCILITLRIVRPPPNGMCWSLTVPHDVKANVPIWSPTRVFDPEKKHMCVQTIHV